MISSYRGLIKPKPGVPLNIEHPLSDGLVGYWPFNEGSGSRAADISGRGNHGTLINMEPNDPDFGWGGSHFGGELRFGGNSDWVSLPLSIPTTYMSANQNYSVVLQVKANATSASQEVMLYSSNSTDRAGITIRAGTIGSGTYNGSDFVNISGDIVASRSHHVVVCHTASNAMLLYIDNVPQYGDVQNSYEDTNLCSISASNSNFAGSVDYVRIYNRLLTLWEIDQLYHNPFCDLLTQRRWYVPSAGPSGAIMNQFQKCNIGANLYNGVLQ